MFKCYSIVEFVVFVTRILETFKKILM